MTQTQVKHTGGQWTVSDTSIVSGKYCIAVIEDDGEYVAPHRQQKANARLIAAAPNLLAACERMARASTNRGERIRSMNGAMVELRAAIAKATGGVQ